MPRSLITFTILLRAKLPGDDSLQRLNVLGASMAHHIRLSEQLIGWPKQLDLCRQLDGSSHPIAVFPQSCRGRTDLFVAFRV